MAPTERNTQFAIASERYVIFSCKPDDRATVQRRLNDLVLIPIPIEGCYKGKREHAWITNLNNWPRVMSVARSFITQEESILHLGQVQGTHSPNDVRPCVLEYFNGNVPEFIGYLWPVSRDTALAYDAWSLKDGQHFVAAFKKPVPVPPTNKARTYRSTQYSGESTVRGHFNKAGKARTPSGHEF